MWKKLTGRIKFTILSADSISLINTLRNAGVFLENVIYINDLELQVTVHRQDYNKLLEICEKQGASPKITGKTGAYWFFEAVRKRPALVIFACLLCFLFAYLPNRILFISVTGNSAVSTNQILEAAENCGIVFGASRRQVRSEKMKNALLQAIPQLQWAGINTSGCTAVISVREKTTLDIQTEKNTQVSSIVASRDGVIQSCTVYKGNALCSVGQAVKAGQTLVSGYLDCGIITKATRADAEINALTFREVEIFSPDPTLVRDEQYAEKTYYSLKIGKKLIKLCKDSGNFDAGCAKIYEENFLQFPGGFQLPIALIKQTVVSYDVVTEIPVESNAGLWIMDFAKTYLINTMVAGEIISEDAQLDKAEGAYYMYGRYACLEMIGQVKYEQTMIKEEDYDGTNRKFRSG